MASVLLGYSKPSSDHNPTPNPTALKADSPLSDPDAFDDQADRVGVAGPHEHHGFAATFAMRMGMIGLPGDIQSTERTWNLELQVSYVTEHVVALAQLLFVQSRQQGIKKVLQLVRVL